MRVPSEQVIGVPGNTGSDLSMLLSQFIQDVGYKGGPNSHDKALFEAMVCFPDFPLDVKVYVGLYSWIGLFIDDEGHTKEVEEFQRRFTAGEEQPTLVLRAWADIINECYSYYDPLSANLIVTSSLYFTTMTNLDHRKEFQGRLPAKHAQDYPLYIRDRSGIGEAFALFTFPKAQFPDLSEYLEAVPSMIAYIGFTNDILS
ncbi:putative Alpha-cuprenene synthase COP6 [Seiridium cardinale]